MVRRETRQKNAALPQGDDSKSSIGAISGGMSPMMAMKTPRGQPPGPAGGAKAVPDNDGDSDRGGESGSAGKRANLSA